MVILLYEMTVSDEGVEVEIIDKVVAFVLQPINASEIADAKVVDVFLVDNQLRCFPKILYFYIYMTECQTHKDCPTKTPFCWRQQHMNRCVTAQEAFDQSLQENNGNHLKRNIRCARSGGIDNCICLNNRQCASTRNCKQNRCVFRTYTLDQLREKHRRNRIKLRINPNENALESIYYTNVLKRGALFRPNKKLKRS